MAALLLGAPGAWLLFMRFEWWVALLILVTAAGALYALTSIKRRPYD